MVRTAGPGGRACPPTARTALSVRAFRSPPTTPRDRGYEFGGEFADEIGRNVAYYCDLFRVTGGLGDDDITVLGAEAFEATAAWAPDLADEIEAIAAGAGLTPELVAALNARTEILGQCRASDHECTVAVSLGPDGFPPVAIQTWDWHDALESGWLVWTVEHPSGRVVHTLTEYGIVGKLGVSSTGIGLLLNILRHDGDRGGGTPIHVITRRVLDEANDLSEALLLICSAEPSASSAMTLVAVEGAEKTALTVEVWPGGPAYVLPNERGILVHTNHFVDSTAAAADQERVLGPDSFLRYEIVRRGLATATPTPGDVIRVLRSHLGGTGAVCCHPDPFAPLGERYATLATITVDVLAGTLDVHPGGPCSHPVNLTPTQEETWLPSS